MVQLSSTLLLAGALASVSVSAFPMNKMGDILDRAIDMNKRGLIKDPKARRALSDVNKRGLDLGSLVGSVTKPIGDLLQALDLPTPQPFGLAPVPDAAHPFKAPGPTDVRGLCPTLNTMANHGYISRTGITTFAEAANACQIAFGFAFDICVGLSALGLVAGGDLVSGKMSIAGADSRVPNTLGENPGIEVHGPFEIDGSITRADTYFGDNHSFKQDRFDAWYAQANETSAGLFDFKTMTANQLSSYELSKSTNPEAYFGVKYFVVSYAERVFIPAALPNGTTQAVADIANIEPFFVEERFPKGWFVRDSPYTAMDTVVDVLDMFVQAPIELGQNQGLGNFVPSDIAIDTSSPTALMCFIVTSIFDELPGFVAAKVATNGPLYNLFLTTVFGQLFGAGSEFQCDLSAYGKSGGNN